MVRHDEWVHLCSNESVVFGELMTKKYRIRPLRKLSMHKPAPWRFLSFCYCERPAILVLKKWSKRRQEAVTLISLRTYCGYDCVLRKQHHQQQCLLHAPCTRVENLRHANETWRKAHKGETQRDGCVHILPWRKCYKTTRESSECVLPVIHQLAR